ncbi:MULTISPECIES: DUF4240 domain-containing protein [unclassified Streptomyces]|uniref:DUF4240 domain-containing protein n=1 Tax=unclassified Streptomyces TaxID=2593676 RepID=UPI001E4659D4|nr:MULTISPECIES: DUF4240 domain-containing protein [unclassified Streptomyces]
MNENAFWQLIGDCTPSMPDPDAEQLAAALTNRLTAGPLGHGDGVRRTVVVGAVPTGPQGVRARPVE